MHLREISSCLLTAAQITTNLKKKIISIKAVSISFFSPLKNSQLAWHRKRSYYLGLIYLNEVFNSLLIDRFY